jgi:predicted permease
MNDIRYTLRFLWLNKAFTVAAVLTLAIGLGANTALFGIMNVALRPLAIPQPEQLVSIATELANDESGGFQYAFSTEALGDMQRRAQSFSDVIGIMPRVAGLSVDGKAAQFFFGAVSENYFSGLGVRPEAGNLLSANGGSPTPVVLGYSFWMKHLGGDPKAIGRQVRINGLPAIVTGVVPRSFQGTFLAVELDGYVTVEDLQFIDPDVKGWLYHNRKARPLQLFGRLKPGVSVRDADLEVDTILQGLAQQYPESDQGITGRVVPEPLARPLPMRAVTEAIPLVQGFAFAVGMLVLLLACMNVANLLLVRSTARQREMAVRAALGASRLRLVRQMVVEGLMLAGLGGAAGLVVGHWVTRTFLAKLDLGADLPFNLDITFDWRVFVNSLVAAMATGILIGIWPAWRASKADARAALHDGGRGQSDSVERQRIRRVLVVGQIAGSLALLVIAGLFVRSLFAAQRMNLGFEVDHIVTVRLDPRQIGYEEARTEEFYKELLRRVRAWGDVDAAAIGFTTPMSYLSGGGSFFIEGKPIPADGQPPATFLNHVGHGYFDTMRIPIVKGRAFVEDDEHQYSGTRRYAIVNETMAEKFWPGQDPIGKRFRVYAPDSSPLEIVGVAKDAKYVLVFEQPRPFFYLPLERDDSLRTLFIRAKGDPAQLMPRIEQEIAGLAPELPMADLRTMRGSLGGIFGYLTFRLGAIQAGGMGVIGLILAIVGVYGVVSFGATLRTREIGIRMALGAQPADVLQLILGQGVQLVFIGLAIGLAAAIGMSRVLTRFLPLVDAADWMTFALIASGLGGLAILACYIPARRATKVPAMTALRHE